jgi:hypothetical protein
MPDFSGLWKPDSDRCRPNRSGDFTLHIDHRNPQLTVETTISRGPENSRRAAQQNSILSGLPTASRREWRRARHTSRALCIRAFSAFFILTVRRQFRSRE